MLPNTLDKRKREFIMKEFCVDLKLAKELKENGFPQNTVYFYARWNSKVIISEQWDLITQPFDSNTLQKPYYSAPTSDEILKELPREIKDSSFQRFYHLKIEQSPIHDEMYFISYGITNQDRAWMETYHTSDKKLSNALAKTWLDLKKEGYIK